MPPRRPKTPPRQPKTPPRCLLIKFFLASVFQCLFGSIFDPNLAPTWPPKPTKIHEKSMPRCLPIMTSFFDRFLIDFCSQLGPPNPENSRPHSCESTIFLKSHFDVHMDFWLDFGPNLAPFCPPKSNKILQKSDPKSHQNFDRFLLRFFFDSGSVLGTKLEPCWPLFRAKTHQDDIFHTFRFSAVAGSQLCCAVG